MIFDFLPLFLHSRVLLHLNINTWLYKIYVHNHIHIFFVGNRGCCEGYSASLHISRPPKHLKPGVAGRSRAHRIGQQRLQNNTPWKINGWNLNLIVWKMIFRISIGWFLGSMLIFRGVLAATTTTATTKTTTTTTITTKPTTTTMLTTRTTTPLPYFYNSLKKVEFLKQPTLPSVNG